MGPRAKGIGPLRALCRRAIRNHSTGAASSSVFKIGNKVDSSLCSSYLPGQCFIHKELAYRGVVLKSIPSEISLNENLEPEGTFVHLVLADEFEIEPRKLVNTRLAQQYHKNMGGDLYSLDLVETKDILPIDQVSSPILNRTINPYFKINSSTSISQSDEDETSLFTYEPRLQALKYLQDQIGQNLQIMRRTYKRNHLYEVSSTLLCYKLKDNPTGSSNWLISVRFNEAESACITVAKIEIFVIQDKVRTYTVEFPSAKGPLLQCNRTIKLLSDEKAGFCYAVISYHKEGWPKEYRLRSNIGILFPKTAMQLMKGEKE